MGPRERRALLRAVLVGGAGSILLVISFWAESRAITLGLSILALALMAAGIALFFNVSKASEQDYRSRE
jgi:hypothetical protein